MALSFLAIRRLYPARITNVNVPEPDYMTGSGMLVLGLLNDVQISYLKYKNSEL